MRSEAAPFDQRFEKDSTSTPAARSLGVTFPDGLQLHVDRTVLLKGARPDRRGREHAGKNRNGRKSSDGLQGRTRNQLHHFSSS